MTGSLCANGWDKSVGRALNCAVARRTGTPGTRMASAPSAHGKDTLCPQRPSHLLRRCRGTPRRRANRASQGVIPHRWLISTIPTTAVTPHNNSDTPWGDSGLARSMSDMRVSPGASHRAGGPGGMVTGESDQAGARPYAPNGKAHPSMGKAIADGRAANKSSRRRH